MLKRTAFMTALLCVCAFPAMASTLDLVENGDFEDDLTVGWDQTIAGDALYIQRATNYDLDPDYEARIYSSNGHGNAKLAQSFMLPDLSTIFSADIKASAVDGYGAWCAAGLMISYMDGNNSVLGKTLLGATSAVCPWVSADDFHIVAIPDSWDTYGFVVGDELANLPAVDPDDVVKLEVALILSAANC